ncbi:helix-turn-helix transcriptional regulator [Streptomyces sp. NPDC093589]|uniref:helix-turn-helix transcriptional regulator n=1 Tax=Streptomyces sp. NPDC093589 TaxID=3366043 RepID=UPI003824A354
MTRRIHMATRWSKTDFTDVAASERIGPRCDRCIPPPPVAGQTTLIGVAHTLGKLSAVLAAEAEHFDAHGSAHHVADGPAQQKGGFRYVHGIAEINREIQHVLNEAEEEILTAQPDGARPEGVLDEALAAVRDRISAGVAMRTLYQHSTRFDEPTKAYVRAATEYGAEIRTLAEFFDRMIVVDRKTAFIPVNEERTVAAVITEAAVVQFLADVFERAWDRAARHPFLPVRAADAATEIIPALRKEICKLLIEGRSDREISRRLGFSLRSLQGHVAQLKKEYGAAHRLQLGYLMGISAASE